MATTNEHQRRRSSLALMLTAMAASLVVASKTNNDHFSEDSNFLRNNKVPVSESRAHSFLRNSNAIDSEPQNGHRKLSALSPMMKLADFKDPKTVTPRSSFDLAEEGASRDRFLKEEEEESSLDDEDSPLELKGDNNEQRQQLSVNSYSFQNALSVFDYFDAGAALFVYDPKEDKFNVLYPNGMIWEESRFTRIRTWVFHSLRLMFPERFHPNAPEFVMPIASMDYPQVNFDKYDCFLNQESEPCVADDFPPILQFGSVFKLPKIPSTIPMPMPENNHLGAFHHWLMHHEVLKLYTERRLEQTSDLERNPNGLVFGETLGLGWDDLIPQVVSRTSDRGYLSRMNKLRIPNFEKHIKPGLVGAENEKDKKVAAVKAMMEGYDYLIPRWKAVAWTSEAELDAEEKGDGSLPWCNIKFAMTFFMDNTRESEYYTELMDHGIAAVGETMDLAALAKYKYHIDIGGGGGTTWSGTFEKLAMPGVLFHHETPTKDYNHASIKPWVHYIPVREDLKDLREKFEWAESHPDEAREISERATAFIRRLGTEDGFEDFVKVFFEEPLRQVLNAYEPMSGNDRTSWQELAKKHGLYPMIKCGGYGEPDDCVDTNDDELKRRKSPLRVQLEIQKQKELQEQKEGQRSSLRAPLKQQRRLSVHPKAPQQII